MTVYILGVNCGRCFKRSREGEVLREMYSTLSASISKESDPVRFADAAYSAGFISEDAKNDGMSFVRNDYGKVSKIMTAVMTHIMQQTNYDEGCRKFHRFIHLLRDELKMKDLAEKLRELAVYVAGRLGGDPYYSSL